MRIAIAVLLAFAILLAQAAYGGLMRPVFAMPAYFALATAGGLSLVALFWKRSVLPAMPPVLATCVFAGYLFWRAWNSPGPELALFYSLLVCACLVAYLLTAVVVTVPSARMAFLVLLLIAVAIQAVLAAMQFAATESYFYPMPWFSEQMRQWFEVPGKGLFRRAQGTFLSGNQLAWFFNVAALLAAAVALFARGPVWQRILLAYMSGVGVVGTVMTGSRGGMLSLLAGTAVAILLSLVAFGIGAPGRRTRLVLTAGGVGLLALGGGVLLARENQAVHNRIDQIASDNYRLRLWPATLRQVQLEPFTGTGAGSFTQLSRRLAGPLSGQNDLYAHNDWAQLAADFGLLGLGLGLLTLGVVLRFGVVELLRVLRERMAVASRPQSSSAAFLIGGLSALAAGAVHSLFDYNMQVPANALLMAACTGMLANSGVPSTTRRAAATAMRMLLVLVLTAAAAVLLLLLHTNAENEAGTLLAENALLAGHPGEASRLAEKVLAEAPDHPRASRILGESLLKVAEGSQQRSMVRLRAAFYLRKAVAADPLERWNHLLLGIALTGSSEPADAERAAVEAIRLDPVSPIAREYHALLLERLGRQEEAIRAYEASMGLPGTRLAHDRLQTLRQHPTTGD